MNMAKTIDAIEAFQELIDKKNDQEFIEWAIDQVVFPDAISVAADFKKLVKEIKDCQYTGSYVRAYGRGGNNENRDSYSLFIKEIIGKECCSDATNNASPTKRFNQNSGIDRGEYKNYKLSHIWTGTSKNPFAFCALWNMCLTPFYIDPLTGHETKSAISTKFQNALRQHVVTQYQSSIKLYNREMAALSGKIEKHFANPSNFRGLSNDNRKKIKENFRLIE
ncbi:MAG: hypothetical protein EOP48_05425 [Sphingobacteriales bacterium]|nr:MAG: hypothetical protein EOP48_05425 [Sphingobacteriales bacterium]